MAGLVDKFKKSSFWSLLGSVISAITTLIYSYFVLKELSVNSYGEYTYALVIFGFYQVLILPGLQLVIRRFGPSLRDFNSNETKFSSKGVLILTISLVGVSSVLTLLGNLSFLGLKSSLIRVSILDSTTSLFLQKLLTYSVFLFGSTLLKECSNSLYNQRTNIVIQSMSDTFKVIYLLSLSEIDVIDILNSLIYSWLLTFACYIIYYHRWVLSFRIKQVYALEWRRYLKYVRYIYFNEAGSKIINSSSDYIIVNFFLGASSTGVYSFANKVVSITGNFMPNRLIRSNLATLYYDRNKENKLGRLRKDFNSLFSFNLFFGTLVFITLQLTGDIFLSNFLHGKYSDSIGVLYVLSWSFVLKPLTHPLGLFLTSLEDVKIIFRSKLLALLNIALLLLLKDHLNLELIAVVSILVYGFKDAVIYVYAFKKYSLRVSSRFTYSLLINLILVVLYKQYFGVNYPLAIVEIMFFCLAAYFLWKKLNKVLQDEVSRVVRI